MDFEVFTTAIDVNDSVVSKEPQKAQLAWARLGQWRLYDNLTRSSVPILNRLREVVEAQCYGRNSLPLLSSQPALAVAHADMVRHGGLSHTLWPMGIIRRISPFWRCIWAAISSPPPLHACAACSAEQRCASSQRSRSVGTAACDDETTHVSTIESNGYK